MGLATLHFNANAWLLAATNSLQTSKTNKRDKHKNTHKQRLKQRLHFPGPLSECCTEFPSVTGAQHQSQVTTRMERNRDEDDNNNNKTQDRSSQGPFGEMLYGVPVSNRAAASTTGNHQMEPTGTRTTTTTTTTRHKTKTGLPNRGAASGNHKDGAKPK